jgi:3-oxoacyl-[acyl-carrier-protein] synthase II
VQQNRQGPGGSAGSPRVFITGVGVISSIGIGKKAFYASLREGRTGLSRLSAFPAGDLGRDVAGEVKNFRAEDHMTRAEARNAGRCAHMAVAAARLAREDSGISDQALAGPRVAVVMGTTMGEGSILGDLEGAWIKEGEAKINRADIPRYGGTLLPIHVARALGVSGLVSTLPAACAAGNYAIGFGADLIRMGRADVVVCGAAELLQELQFAGFVRLAAMAKDRCRPFDVNREGLILGEGAGVLILESEAHAVKRNAAPQAEVLGMGLTCDGYHITRPHPDAAGSIEAMRQAIARSGISPSAVDFVNAHGTGTKANDVAETKVMHDVFGDRRVPISSMKSMLGHCMGAASAIEAVGCVFTLETGIYPPTIGYETPDPECNVDVVANVAREGKADIVLNNSLAFGGYNAVTCFSRPYTVAELGLPSRNLT